MCRLLLFLTGFFGLYLIGLYGYGFVAENNKTLHSLLNKLLIDEPTLLDKIRDNQRNCKDVDGAKTIAKKVIELFKDNS